MADGRRRASAAGQTFSAAEMPVHPEGLSVTAEVDVTFLLTST